MKNLVHSKAARYVALFLTVLCGTLSIASASMLYVTASLELYDKKWSAIKKECYERVQSLYSMKIFEEREDNPGCLNETNMEYGILEGDKYSATDFESAASEIDFDDADSYYYQNFNKTSPDKHSFVREFHGHDSLEYNLNLFGSLFNPGYIVNDGYSEEHEEEIETVYYNKDNGLFYYKAGSYCIPVRWITIDADDNITEYILDYTTDKTPKYVKEYSSGEAGSNMLMTQRYQNWDHVFFDDTEFDIQPVTSKDMESFVIPTVDSEEDYHIYSSSGQERRNMIYFQTYSEDPGSSYWVISRVKDPLDESTNDLFVRQLKLVHFLYVFRYAFIIIAAICALLCLGFLIFCCRNIGYEAHKLQGQEKICYRVPLLIYLAVMGVLFLIDIYIGLCGIEYLRRATDGTLPIIITGLFFVTAAGIWLVLMTLLNLSYRYQAKILWKNTILRRILRRVSRFSKALRDNTSLVLRAGLILAVFGILELIVIAYTNYRVNLELFCFVLYKIPETAFIFVVLLQMKKLQEGSRQLAQGDLESKIDTQSMLWEFKKHGEYLNQINDGMAIALQDKMKSEHFKTELITNVSHDIKTPLTSIINYIDLMKREHIDEPAVQEYLEVLDHHSARLKKLIEDLIEASKASTGNLTVNWEPCDVDILLTQVLGEFEERMETAQLDLIIDKQEKPVYIMADNRHLWRIFENLMNNICKYAQSGTRVYINQNVEQGMVNIVFRNTSKYPLNITSEELLERFVRGDASRNTEGSGLGLSIAQNLAELMNGELELYVDGDLFKVILRFPQK